MSSGSQPQLPGVLSSRRPRPLLEHTGRENVRKTANLCRSCSDQWRGWGGGDGYQGMSFTQVDTNWPWPLAVCS